jgi:hypothetical protein
MPDYEYSFPNMNPDEYFRGINVAQLPAGMRNNNIGNIKHTDWSSKLPGAVGPSQNRDQGDPQVVFSSPEAGVAATARLALNKYTGGMNNLNTLIAGQKGWTPGNTAAAANIAKTMGVKPDEDLNLSDPNQMTKFVRALATQEHGPDSKKYTDATINTGVGSIFGKDVGSYANAQPSPVGYGPMQGTQAGLLGAAMPQAIAGPMQSASMSMLPQNNAMSFAAMPQGLLDPNRPQNTQMAQIKPEAPAQVADGQKDFDYAKLAGSGIGMMAAAMPKSAAPMPQMGQIHRPQINKPLFAGLLRNPWDV